MAVNLSPVYGVAGQLFDNNGNPLAGGKIYTYLAGTTTNAATYTSSSGVTAHSNPIVLDGAGRVPSGEIWLTDGITYKFVVEDSASNLIGTYDNLSGINSNFIAYTAQQEIQTATAGQTVFTLTTMQYQPNTNNLSVFVDGVNQYGPGAQYAFIETSSTVITFVSGLHVGASVKFTTASPVASNVTDAENVIYDPPFVGSVSTNVEAKLAQTVSVKDFGASPSATTATNAAAFQNAIDYVNSLGGGEIFIPTGTYDIGANTLVMKTGVTLRGEGNTQSAIESSTFVLDYGSWAVGGTQNCKLYSLQLNCSGTDGCILLTGQASGDSVTGDIVAFDVYFNGDQSIVIDETKFFYSGFWNIDRCIFRKFLHLSTTSNLNGQGFGMLVNTIRLTNSTFGTVSNTADYAIKFASAANPTGVNQTLIQGCIFEVTSAGGIQYLGGNQHAFHDCWFYDGTGPYNAVRIEADASFVSIKNVFARDTGGCSISNVSSGPVVIENTNITTGNTTNPGTALQPPRITSTFTPITGPLLWGFNNNGDSIYLSTNKLAGMQAINILIPPTTGAGVVAIPIPAQYTDCLFHFIVACKLKNGDTAIADPGGTYTLGLRVFGGSPPGALFTWNNANTPVAAYEEILTNTSGAYDSTDYTDFLDPAPLAAARPNMYVDLVKQGGGVNTGYMYVTLYVM